jgi:hypothetical protein
MFEKLGKFQTKRVLGSVAMGEVYLGADPAIGREVAIKADPSNANAHAHAHAWLAVVPHHQRRVGEFIHELREARRHGLPGPMAQHARFRPAFNQARLNQGLPPVLVD